MSTARSVDLPDLPGLLDLVEPAERLRAAFRTRLVLISPPRTGSTPVARLLWQHSAVGYHCHEPFEAGYWGAPGPAPVSRILLNPMRVADGERIEAEAAPDDAGLLIKEMSFQLTADHFGYLAGLATAPVVFVLRDPRLCVTSRLRIVRELTGATTFPAFESGWQSLGEQVEYCRERGIGYVIVDSADLRTDPAPIAEALIRQLGLAPEPGLHTWAPRPGLQLCLPEVGELMGELRAADDPFYRRVLSSPGIQTPDEVDWLREQERIDEAGLADDAAAWQELYRSLLADPRRIRPPRAAAATAAPTAGQAATR